MQYVQHATAVAMKKSFFKTLCIALYNLSIVTSFYKCSGFFFFLFVTILAIEDAVCAARYCCCDELIVLYDMSGTSVMLFTTKVLIHPSKNVAVSPPSFS